MSWVVIGSAVFLLLAFALLFGAIAAVGSSDDEWEFWESPK